MEDLLVGTWRLNGEKSEYAALLASEGFELINVVPTESGLSIVEAIAV